MSKVKGGKLDSFDIRAHNPLMQWVKRILILLAMIVIGLSSYYVGYQRGDKDQIQAQANISALAQEILDQTTKYAQLNQQYNALQEQHSHLKLAAQIDASQVEAFRLKDIEQYEEINELEAHLAFYQSIMSPSDMKKGLTIEQFEIVDGPTLKVILTQVTDKPSKIIGTFQVSITGLLNGETKVYKLSDVSSSADSIKFGFKFFQRFSVDLAFDEGFEPQSVELIAKQTGSSKTVTNTISWPSAN